MTAYFQRVVEGAFKPAARLVFRPVDIQSGPPRLRRAMALERSRQRGAMTVTQKQEHDHLRMPLDVVIKTGETNSAWR